MNRVLIKFLPLSDANRVNTTSVELRNASVWMPSAPPPASMDGLWIVQWAMDGQQECVAERTS